MNATKPAQCNFKKVFTGIIKRPLLSVTIMYILGLIGGRVWLEDQFNWLVLAVILLAALCGLTISKLIETYKAVLLLLAVTCGAAAYLFATVPAASGLLNYTGSPVYVEGVVADEPLIFEDHAAYRLKVDLVETNDQIYSIQGMLLLKIYSSEEEKYWFGERLRIRGTISEPRGKRNPGGFDYRLYLFSQGIDALMYPNPAQIDILPGDEKNNLAALAVKTRASLTGAIGEALPSPAGELLTAILFGERHRLPSHIENYFRCAGIGHLMAVSGLHVGLIAAMIIGLWKRLGLRGQLPLILAMVIIFVYVYLTGMRPSALRAAVMISAVLGALLLDREYDLPSALALAALITLLINPLQLFSVGFQFSYIATLALIYAYRPLEQILKQLYCPGLIRPAAAVTLAAQIGVLPLGVYYFHHLPVGALFFNLLILPLVTFIVALGLSGALISLVLPLFGSIVLWASRPLLEMVLIISRFSSQAGLYNTMLPPTLVQLCLFYSLLAGGLFFYYQWEKHTEDSEEALSLVQYAKYILNDLLFKKQFRKQAVVGITLVLAVVVIWSGIFFPAQPVLTVIFIDVGQGASALIITPCEAVILVDAGGIPAFRGDPGVVGEMIVLPFLRNQGIKSIDLAIITHPHEDHFGGFIPIVEAVTIDHMLISPVDGGSAYYHHLLARAEFKGTQIQETWAGQFWYCGGDLMLEIISPLELLFQGTGSDLNNNSLVFIVHYGDTKMLFTGDIEDAAAERLIRDQINLQADLLLIPHHGGFMAAMPAFIDKVQPSIAVIQVGPNSFGHPSPFVINTLEDAGINIFRNDLHGAIIIETDGTEMWITTMIKQPAAAR